MENQQPLPDVPCGYVQLSEACAATAEAMVRENKHCADARCAIPHEDIDREMKWVALIMNGVKRLPPEMVQVILFMATDPQGVKLTQIVRGGKEPTKTEGGS